MQKIDAEENLIHKIRQNDQVALAMVYRTHFPMIVHFIFQNSGTEQDAKDIYQDAMIVLFEKLKDTSFQLNCQIKTFIYSISRRLWLKRLNEKSRFVAKIEDSEKFIDFDKLGEEIDDDENHFVMMDLALAQLGEPCRTILIDFYIQKMTMQAICEKMGYTNPDNAKTQKYKCLQRLKKLFFKNKEAK